MLETILDYWRGASLFVASCNLICETIVWNVNMHIWKNNYFGCNITCYFLCSSYDCYCQPQRHSFLWYSSLSLPQTNAYYSSLWNQYSLVWVPPPIYIYISCFKSYVCRLTMDPMWCEPQPRNWCLPCKGVGFPISQSGELLTNFICYIQSGLCPPLISWYPHCKSYKLTMLYSIRSMSPLSSMDTLVAFSFRGFQRIALVFGGGKCKLAGPALHEQHTCLNSDHNCKFWHPKIMWFFV